MPFLSSALDLFLHLDTHLQLVIAHYGTLTYGFLFVLIFCETGLVIAPFLPGDSLLFAAGAFAAPVHGSFNPLLLFVLLAAAAILGDTVNYSIGKAAGSKIFEKDHRFLNRRHLLRTQQFYETYGAKTIIIARFIPVIRTVAPFVAGIGRMRREKFATYNIIGGFAWVALFIFGGYFFGTLPAVEHNFSLVILAIIFLSVLPAVIEYLRQKRSLR